MALIGNNASTLLDGLSSFWTTLFKDIGDLQAVYEGTEITLGQAYLDMMEDVLNIDVTETPLFHKEYYRLITIREDQVIYSDGGADTSKTRYVFKPSDLFTALPQLQNKVFNPTAAYEQALDYELTAGELHFKQDPLDPTASRGFARRELDVEVAGFFTASGLLPLGAPGVGTTATVIDAFTDPDTHISYVIIGEGEGVHFAPTGTVYLALMPSVPGGAYTYSSIDTYEGFGDVFTITTSVDFGLEVHTGFVIQVGAATPALQRGDTLLIGVPPATTAYTIVAVLSDRIALSAATPLPVYPAGMEPASYVWSVTRTYADGTTAAIRSGSGASAFIRTNILRVNQVSFWAIDAHIDDYRLYTNFGHLFGEQRLSTEAYRAFIRGLMQLYILGPAIDRVESALNVVAGYPVIRDDGEILQSYTSGLASAGTAGTLTGNVFYDPDAAFSTADLNGYLEITAAHNAANVGVWPISAIIDATHIHLTGDAFINETLTLTWELTRTNQQVVTTDKQTYAYPRHVPLRTDIKDPANFDVLTFRAFEPLTTAVLVTDYIKDPEWWHHIVIPQNLMPGASLAQRNVSTVLYPLLAGPLGNARVGDPGLFTGCDEFGTLQPGAQGNGVIHFHYPDAWPAGDVPRIGYWNPPPGDIFYMTPEGGGWFRATLPPVVPPTNMYALKFADSHGHETTSLFLAGPAEGWYDNGWITPPTEPLRHNGAFIFMDRFLQAHLFCVRIDPTVKLTGILTQDLEKILYDVKPVHTALYFQPVTLFTDEIVTSEMLLEVTATVRLNDLLAVTDNLLYAGSENVTGEEFDFADDTGPALIPEVTRVAASPIVHSQTPPRIGVPVAITTFGVDGGGIPTWQISIDGGANVPGTGFFIDTADYDPTLMGLLITFTAPYVNLDTYNFSTASPGLVSPVTHVGTGGDLVITQPIGAPILVTPPGRSDAVITCGIWFAHDEWDTRGCWISIDGSYTGSVVVHGDWEAVPPTDLGQWDPTLAGTILNFGLAHVEDDTYDFNTDSSASAEILSISGLSALTVTRAACRLGANVSIVSKGTGGGGSPAWQITIDGVTFAAGFGASVNLGVYDETLDGLIVEFNTPWTLSDAYQFATIEGVGSPGIKLLAGGEDPLIAPVHFPSARDAKTVHVQIPSTWGPAAHLYWWDQAGSPIWPGLPMAPEGNRWYRFTFASATSTGIVFNDGAMGRQTVDLRWDGTHEGWYVIDLSLGVDGSGYYRGAWYDAQPALSNAKFLDMPLSVKTRYAYG